MTKPINIYSVSRLHDEQLFNIVESHQSQREHISRFQSHEIESLRKLSDSLLRSGIDVQRLENFFWGFKIPQIGKEFDLLKFTDNLCLNLELKSTSVPDEQITDQLLRNRYYLRHLGKKLTLFSVVTDDMTCYRLTCRDELEIVDFSVVVNEVKRHSEQSLNHIDDLFNASDYLVSPLNTPEKFIQGEFFLTQQQEQIKKDVLQLIERAPEKAFFHITGKPGTGKTLLLYDIAKSLSKKGRTVIIHCGKLSYGQNRISNEVANLSVVPASELRTNKFSLSEYAFVLIDECHRFYPQQFDYVCKETIENRLTCIFSSDPEQVLSSTEKKNRIVEKIDSLDLNGKFCLSEKIRMNHELHSFILQMKNLNHRPQKKMNYPNVDLNYANTTAEAQLLIEYYRNEGYVFINYSKSNRNHSPYEQYEEDFDTHHVIGQEFDKVLMLMDKSFYYDDNGYLCGISHPNPDYLYPNLFYQGITRVRDKIALIIIDAPSLMKKIASIFEDSSR